MSTQKCPTIPTEVCYLVEQADEHSAEHLAAMRRCIGDHAQALLVVLAAAGDDWDASPRERRLVAALASAKVPPPEQSAASE